MRLDKIYKEREVLKIKCCRFLCAVECGWGKSFRKQQTIANTVWKGKMGTRKLRLLYEMRIAPVTIHAVAETLGNKLCVGLDTFFFYCSLLYTFLFLFLFFNFLSSHLSLTPPLCCELHLVLALTH